MTDSKINCNACKFSVYLDGDDYCKLHEVLYDVKWRTKDIMWSDECPLNAGINATYGITSSIERKIINEKANAVKDISDIYPPTIFKRPCSNCANEDSINICDQCCFNYDNWFKKKEETND